MKDAPKDARSWWNAFENENASRLALSLRLAEKLGRRNATVASFHTTFRLSGVNDVRANLYFLDYRRLKEEKEQKKKAEEERQQREEAREKRRQERVAAAIHRWQYRSSRVSLRNVLMKGVVTSPVSTTLSAENLNQL